MSAKQYGVYALTLEQLLLVFVLEACVRVCRYVNYVDQCLYVMFV